MKEESLDRVILFLIEQVNKRAKRHAQRRMDATEMGVTIDQWVLLKVIERLGAGTQREVAVEVARDPASITRSLDLLAKKGLIRREEVEGDRRAFGIVLTDGGKAFIQAHMPLIQSLRTESTQGFSDEEVRQLRDLLERMLHNFDP